MLNPHCLSKLNVRYFSIPTTVQRKKNWHLQNAAPTQISYRGYCETNVLVMQWMLRSNPHPSLHGELLEVFWISTFSRVPRPKMWSDNTSIWLVTRCHLPTGVWDSSCANTDMAAAKKHGRSSIEQEPLGSLKRYGFTTFIIMASKIPSRMQGSSGVNRISLFFAAYVICKKNYHSVGS